MDIMDELQYTNVWKKTNFIQIENSFINNPKYTPIEKLIYMSLCTYAFQKNNCYPSHITLSENLGVAKPTIIRNLKSLEDKIDNRTGEFISESLDMFRVYKEIEVVIKGR